MRMRLFGSAATEQSKKCKRLVAMLTVKNVMNGTYLQSPTMQLLEIPRDQAYDNVLD